MSPSWRQWTTTHQISEVSSTRYQRNSSTRITRLIVPYLRDLNVDLILIRMIETMVMYSKTDFLASVTCPVEKVRDTVERIASRIYADRDSLFQLINMMRDARGVGVVAVQPVVTKAASVSTTAPAKVATKTTVKSVVKTVACKDPETGWDVMKAEDGSAYYSKDLKELIRCDKSMTILVIPDCVEKLLMMHSTVVSNYVRFTFPNR